MGPWTSHGQSYYNCNRFEDKDAVDARDAQSKSRADLERYLHVLFSSFCILYLFVSFGLSI